MWVIRFPGALHTEQHLSFLVDGSWVVTETLESVLFLFAASSELELSSMRLNKIKCLIQLLGLLALNNFFNTFIDE